MLHRLRLLPLLLLLWLGGLQACSEDSCSVCVGDDVDHQWVELERNAGAIGDGLEQADVLGHEVEGEVDVFRLRCGGEGFPGPESGR